MGVATTLPPTSILNKETFMQSVLVVTSAASTYDLTTLAAVKAELGLTTTAEDVNIATWISQASAACSAYCNRTLRSETITETFRSGSNESLIYLARIPVGTVTSVTEDGVVLVANTDYQLDATVGVIYRLSDDVLVDWNFSKLIVVYAAGYTTTALLPDDIERACISLTKTLRGAATRDPLVKQESIPGVLDTSYWVGTTPGSTGNLPPDVQALLDPYREISV